MGHDRFHHRACAPAQRWGEKGGCCQAIGRSRGGLSTKIHAITDALGNPTGFHLTPGQAHDQEGADALLPGSKAQTVIADKGYDAKDRVVEPLLEADKAVGFHRAAPTGSSATTTESCTRHAM